jgi:hypothetical protein
LAETREATCDNVYRAKLQKCAIKEVEIEIPKTCDVGILTADEGNIHSVMPNGFNQMVNVFTPACQEDTKAKGY